MAYSRDNHHNFLAPPLSDLYSIDHGFGTRLTENWLNADAVSTLRQIHSARVVVADGDTGRLGEGDALITRRPGLWIGVRTADCVPILIADRKRQAVAAIHAGWRGTVLRIAPATVAALHTNFGSSPEDLVAAIGPGIGICCYRVGPEVAREFQRDFPERSDLHAAVRIDLLEANRRQLADTGIPPQQISVAGICTRCDPEMHSFRRDGAAAGRMISAIRIRPPGEPAGR